MNNLLILSSYYESASKSNSIEITEILLTVLGIILCGSFFGIICAKIASAYGKSAVAWFILGFILLFFAWFILVTIVLANPCVSNSSITELDTKEQMDLRKTKTKLTSEITPNKDVWVCKSCGTTNSNASNYCKICNTHK